LKNFQIIEKKII